MSVLQKVESLGCLLSHDQYLKDLYKGHFIDGLFNLKTPFLMDEEAKKAAALLEQKEQNNFTNKKQRRKKRKNIDSCIISIQEESIRKKMKFLLQKLDFGKSKPSLADIGENNARLRSLAKNLMNNSVQGDKEPEDFSASGCNSKDELMHATFNGKSFIIPPESQYHCINISKMNQKLDRKVFKVVLLDPPWINKHVKRQKTYQSMSNHDIIDSLPNVNDFINEESLVMFWCTPSEKMQKAIDDWLKIWNLVKKATWYWLKVTTFGEPVTKWEHPHKKPYEIIVLAGKQENSVKLENEYIVTSVPSAIHSHKPPLWPLLRDMKILDDNDECLEIFGRYLLPKTVTIGNQCLLFQDTNVFFPKYTF